NAGARSVEGQTHCGAQTGNGNRLLRRGQSALLQTQQPHAFRRRQKERRRSSGRPALVQVIPNPVSPWETVPPNGSQPHVHFLDKFSPGGVPATAGSKLAFH